MYTYNTKPVTLARVVAERVLIGCIAIVAIAFVLWCVKGIS